jgi:glucose/mannose-6-phosphate isomerase
MTILDTPAKWEDLDLADMYGHIQRFPNQVAEAIDIGGSANLGSLQGPFDHIVVAGLGGSAIGGDLVRSYTAEWLKVPMVVVRDYVLPNYVGRGSLVLVSSYSGNTEETLSAYSQAHTQGARILAFTTGGQLAQRAQADGHAVVTLPGGLMPRAALGYSFFPMLSALGKLGLIPDPSTAMSEAQHILAQRVGLYGKDCPQKENAAKRAALAWHKRIPIIYGGTVRFDAVALRIKCQITENAKQLAFNNAFPEFNHNELVGYGHIEPLAKKLAVCILRDGGDHRRTGFRMAIVAKMIGDLNIDVLEMESVGTDPLARMFSIIQWGDFASFYLAMLNGVDPTPIAAIEHLKHELAERS